MLKGQSNDAITLTYPVRPAHFSVVKKTFSNESTGLILFVYPEGLKFKMILYLLQKSVWDLQIIHTKRYWLIHTLTHMLQHSHTRKILFSLSNTQQIWVMSLGEFPYCHPHRHGSTNMLCVCVCVQCAVRVSSAVSERTSVYTWCLPKPSSERRNTVNREQFGCAVSGSVSASQRQWLLISVKVCWLRLRLGLSTITTGSEVSRRW